MPSDSPPGAPAVLPNARQLQWQCRRGMLELDLLLEAFLQRGYDGLTEAEQRLFIRMLDFEDQLLLDWLMGHVVPADRGICQLLEKIRAAT